MPTWRAVTSGRRRLVPQMSSTLKPKASAVASRITLGVICPYSPLGIPMCKATNPTETDTTSSGPRPTPRTKAEAIAAIQT